MLQTELERAMLLYRKSFSWSPCLKSETKVPAFLRDTKTSEVDKFCKILLNRKSPILADFSWRWLGRRYAFRTADRKLAPEWVTCKNAVIGTSSENEMQMQRSSKTFDKNWEQEKDKREWSMLAHNDIHVTRGSYKMFFRNFYNIGTFSKETDGLKLKQRPTFACINHKDWKV